LVSFFGIFFPNPNVQKKESIEKCKRLRRLKPSDSLLRLVKILLRFNLFYPTSPELHVSFNDLMFMPIFFYYIFSLKKGNFVSMKGK